ncbi:MAG: hypothetical protein M5R36_22750 [Deltaproteobacteria bacterium]|nr:hypothetical protein [Deltaproteobacteria bacterium]
MRLFDSLFRPGLRPLRVAILVAAAFVLTDALFAGYVHRAFRFPTFRFPADSKTFLDEYLTYLESDTATRTFFVGDSVIQGQHLADGETVPVQYAGAANAPAVNLGLTAAKTPDFFFLTGRLPSRPGATVIYNVNYKNFCAYDLSVPLRFRDLFDPALARTVAPDLRDALNAPENDPASASVVRRHWFLLRHRDWVNAALFGGHPRQQIKGYVDQIAARGLGSAWRHLLQSKTETPATRKDWPARSVEILRSYYRAMPLNDTNAVFRMIGPTARLARDRQFQPVFFANPMNRALLDRFQAIDWALYGDNVLRVRQAVETGGGVFFDYTNLLAPRHFVDNDHVTAEGARLLAGRLYRDIIRAAAPEGGE